MIPATKAETVFQYFSGMKTLVDMEAWIYSSEVLEFHLNDEDYVSIIAVDFRKSNASHLVYKIQTKNTLNSDYVFWEISRIIRHIIARSDKVHEYILRVYELYCMGYNFLRKLALDFGLKVAAPPNHEDWGSLTCREKQDLVAGFYPEIIDHAERVLRCLRDRKIEFLEGERDADLPWIPRLSNPRYIDRRTRQEKRLMTIKMTQLDKAPIKFLYKLFGVQISTYRYD